MKLAEIIKYNKEQCDELFKNYMSGKLKTQSYMNVLFSLNRKNDKRLKKIKEEAFPGKENKKLLSYASIFLHNNNDIKKYKEYYGEPVSTKELGEYGDELKCSYFYIFKILDKNVVLFVDDRGTGIEVEKNINDDEFIEIYRTLLYTMIKANKDYSEQFLKD